MTDIFNNYDVDVAYEDAKDFLTDMAIENGESPDDVTEAEIWDRVREMEAEAWETDVESLIDFLSDKTVIFQGTIGRWNGTFPGGKIGDFEDLLQEFLKDCDFVRIWDKDSHLFVRGSHHDGTIEAEVRILTEKGIEIYEDWKNYEGPFNDLSEQELHTKIMNNDELSEIPKFVERAWQA